MAKPSKIENQLQEFLAEQAASAIPDEFPEFDDLVDSYEEVGKTAGYLLKPNQSDPSIVFSSIGRGEGNAACTGVAKEIAGDLGLAPQFEALKIRYSKANRSFLGVPVATYVGTDKTLARVYWSPDASVMRVDFGRFLLAEKWRIATGYELPCEVRFIRNHPKVRSAMVILMNQDALRETRDRIRRREQAKKKKQEEEAQKAAAEAKANGTEPAKAAENKPAEAGETPKTQATTTPDNGKAPD